MLSHFKKVFFTLFFLQQVGLCADEIFLDRQPVAMVYNPGPQYSLINSVDYHPSQQLCCVTYTHGNKVILYSIDNSGKPKMFQCLSNPQACLSEPQHAVFSPDGEKLVVINWTNQMLTVYLKEKSGFFSAQPSAIISPPTLLSKHKPHGIGFSPCGNYLAIAYGCACYYGRAVALFSVSKDGLKYEFLHALEGKNDLAGIPKGITFSPDGTCLLVTFSDLNSLNIYSLSKNKKTIVQAPRQVIQGDECKISRPEDVKVSADGNYCAVSNSDQNNVSFYSYDKINNLVTQSTPCDILKNPEANFHFPHGIAFSPDGSFLIVTEFGKVDTSAEGNIVWDDNTIPEQSKFNVYKLTK